MNTKYKVIFILSILALAYFNHFVIKDEELNMSEIEKTAATVTKTKSSGQAWIGGEFSLVNQDGEKITEESLKGKTSIIYFGFTHCPMICPTALSTITLAMNEIDPDGKKYTPVFITTDPERDKPERLKEYLESFHPSTIGLTGEKEELEKAYKAYKVYAKKVMPEDNNKNYDMNHSSIIYIMDENGKYIAHFSHQSKVEEIVTKLNSL